MNIPQILYRAALGNDAWEMVGVHYAAIQVIGAEHYSHEVRLAWSPPPDDRRRQWLAELIAQDTTLSMVAISDQNKIVGFCLALPAHAQLKALYVHPDFAGQHIGKSLLQHIEAQCQDIGIKSMELNASYNAEGFYQRNGYRALGPVTQPLSEQIAMGAIRMAKQLALRG